jgi:transporter family protein
MWPIYALLSALTAALVAIFAKIGLEEIDPTLATTVRSVIMATFLLVVSTLLRKFENFSLATFNSKEWLLIALAGFAGASSWLFYFLALKQGSAIAVVAIDKLSIVFVVFLAAIFLNEAIGWRTTAGSMLMVLGAILISLKDDDIARLWSNLLTLVK